jgi:hypothetical protein
VVRFWMKAMEGQTGTPLYLMSLLPGMKAID